MFHLLTYLLTYTKLRENNLRLTEKNIMKFMQYKQLQSRVTPSYTPQRPIACDDKIIEEIILINQ